VDPPAPLIPRFPTGLKSLKISINDSHDLDGLLPPELTTLVVRSPCAPTLNHPLTFPRSLRHLELHCQKNIHSAHFVPLLLFPGFLPESLEYLRLSSIANETIDTGLLPSKLVKLDIIGPLTPNFKLARNALPSSLQLLRLSFKFTPSITTLSDEVSYSLSSLRELYFRH
jgi:hypothetical protein